MSSAKAKFILTLYRQDVNLVNKAEAFGNRLYSYKKNSGMKINHSCHRLFYLLFPEDLPPRPDLPEEERSPLPDLCPALLPAPLPGPSLRPPLPAFEARDLLYSFNGIHSSSP